jgi:5-methylcytosine-specific restriction endonuclease McrA
MMPTSPAAACLEPRCPGRAVPGGRGRCERHYPTRPQYAGAWPAQSRAQRRAFPYCQRCGATVDLVADHVVNGDPSRLATLCRPCNTAKRNRERGPR